MADTPDSQPSQFAPQGANQVQENAVNAQLSDVHLKPAKAQAEPASYQDFLAQSQQQAQPQAAPQTYQDFLNESQKAPESVTDKYLKPLAKGALASLPAVGGIVGGLAGAPAGPVTGVAGAGLGYGAGKALENMGLNAMGEGPKTEQEALTAPFKAIPEGMAQEMGGQIVGKAVGTAANAVSKALAKTVPADDILLAEARQNVARLQQLKEAGIDQPFTAGTINPNNPTVAEQGNKLAASKEAKAATIEAIDKIQNSWQQLNEQVARYGSNTAGLGKEALDLANGADAAEGKMIGLVRDTIKDTAGQGKFTVDGTKQALQKVLDGFGVVAGKDGSSPLTKMHLDDFGMTPGNATVLTNTVNKLQDTIANGGNRLTMPQIIQQYQKLNSVINNLGYDTPKGPGTAFNALVTLKNALRDELPKIGNVILEKAGGAESPTIQNYQRSMSTFSKLKGAQETLSNWLDKDDIATKTLANKVFSPGNLDKLDAMKTLLEHEHPEKWQELVGAHINNITESTGGNFAKIQQAYSKMGDDILGRIYGPDKVETVKNFLDTAAKYQGEYNKAMAAKDVGLIQKITPSFMKGILGGAVKIAGQIGLSNAAKFMGMVPEVVQYYSSHDPEALVAGLGGMKSQARRVVLAVLQNASNLSNAVTRGAMQNQQQGR